MQSWCPCCGSCWPPSSRGGLVVQPCCCAHRAFLPLPRSFVLTSLRYVKLLLVSFLPIIIGRSFPAFLRARCARLAFARVQRRSGQRSTGRLSTSLRRSGRLPCRAAAPLSLLLPPAQADQVHELLRRFQDALHARGRALQAAQGTRQRTRQGEQGAPRQTHCRCRQLTTLAG